MVAIIIINYKNEKCTVDFIKNEISKVKCEHKVIVIDNGSTTTSYEQLCNELPSDTVVLRSSENLGFARANNLGAAYSSEHFKAEYILFTNSDIHFNDNDIVEKMIDKISTLDDVAVIGPKVIGLDGKLQSPAPFIPFADRHILIYWSNLYLSQKKKISRFKLDYAEKAREGYHYIVSGCCFLVKAADYAECGGMDSETFLYAEEMILSERLKCIGKKVYYYPEISVIHEHGKTTGSHYRSIQLRQMKFESDCYYYSKYTKTPSILFLIAKFTYFCKRICRK